MCWIYRLQPVVPWIIERSYHHNTHSGPKLFSFIMKNIFDIWKKGKKMKEIYLRQIWYYSHYHFLSLSLLVALSSLLSPPSYLSLSLPPPPSSLLVRPHWVFPASLPSVGHIGWGGWSWPMISFSLSVCTSVNIHEQTYSSTSSHLAGSKVGCCLTPACPPLQGMPWRKDEKVFG